MKVWVVRYEGGYWDCGVWLMQTYTHSVVDSEEKAEVLCKDNYDLSYQEFEVK